eukprot:TRINITY_DN3313_c0_g1_i3.p1 TRINITY_DN3313_c0_g1~~TRINITY_DN3313_c0_g1_i3.p1  ORF type:complete len:175 (-),score=20.64 TRINITY_DN3313_c0_g1_i3:426-950(-)
METQAGPLKKVFISTQSQAVDDLEYFTVNFNDSKRKLVFQKYRDQFFEMKKVNTGTSAFAGEHIISDGSIYLLTQLDMAYLFLSFLDQLKRKNERLKSILLKDLPSYFDNSEEKEIIQRLIKSEKASQKLNKICNISIIGESCSTYVNFRFGRRVLDGYILKQRESVRLHRRKS